MSENNQGIEVLWLAESGYHEGAILQEHAHQEYYQIHYILDGGGTFLINHEPIEFDVEMFFFIPPGVSHGIRNVRVGADNTLRMLEVKFAVFDTELKEELAKLPTMCCGTHTLRELIYQIFLESIQKDAFYEKAVYHLFTTWLYQAIRLYKNYNQDTGKKKLQPRVTTRIKTYLKDHYAEDITLDKLAEITGYTKNYLCRIFRENTGMTINSYLSEVRISNAANLLTCTDLDVAEIGQRCGYNSPFYFIKAFKKIIGVPPGNYRKSELAGTSLVIGEVESVNSAIRTSGFNILRTAK